MATFTLQIVDKHHNCRNFQNEQKIIGEPYNMGIYAEATFHMPSEYLQTGEGNCGRMPISGAKLHSFKHNRVNISSIQNDAPDLSINLSAQNLEALGNEIFTLLQKHTINTIEKNGLSIEGTGDDNLRCQIEMTPHSTKASILTVAQCEKILKKVSVKKETPQAMPVAEESTASNFAFDDGFGHLN